MIREIKQENIPQCVHIIRESFRTVAEEYGYYENGEIVGYYSLLLLDASECELNNLCVLPEYRHKKIGQALLEHAFEMARNKGCKKMNMGIVEENLLLRKWYESHGFVHTKTEKFDFFPFTCGYMIKEL